MLPSHLDFLLSLTARTARAVWPQWGRGQKDLADKLCVDTLRRGFEQAPFRARVVIGEGEKDHAPQLYRGEVIGPTAAPLLYDLAVDPLECTSFFANGLPNSLVVLALAPTGTMRNCGDSFYMDKIALPARLNAAAGWSSTIAPLLTATVDYQRFLPALARALDKNINDLTIYMLDKDRHQPIKKSIMAHGARMINIPAGDIVGALLAMTGLTPYHWRQDKKPNAPMVIDALLGVGGSPEGVIAALAANLLAAPFWGRFAPQSAAEQTALEKADYDFTTWYPADQLVQSIDHKNACVILTGITDGMAVPGVAAAGDMATSLVVDDKGARLVPTSLD
ncbi:MAG: fructose-bisphosphatase class II [Alphaproteobacteria bacterium]|nr:fructose-bisphosphatase class II [Alphaproteobacteria bacterium]